MITIMCSNFLSCTFAYTGKGQTPYVEDLSFRYLNNALSRPTSTSICMKIDNVYSYHCLHLPLHVYNPTSMDCMVPSLITVNHYFIFHDLK